MRLDAAVAIAFVLGLASCAKETPPEPDGSQAFVGMRLFDGTGADAIPNGVMVVRDGRIEAVVQN